MHDLSHRFDLLLVVFTIVSAVITIGWSGTSPGAGSRARRRSAFLWFGGSLRVVVLAFAARYERLPFLRQPGTRRRPHPGQGRNGSGAARVPLPSASTRFTRASLPGAGTPSSAPMPPR